MGKTIYTGTWSMYEEHLTRKEKDLMSERVSAMIQNQFEAFRHWQEAKHGHTVDSEEEGSMETPPKGDQ